ncbi:hypothetical protein MNBD_GAMMA15-1190 [hydrothermal vent metagenome]|uniref:Glycosyltransferase subfamily 4-like N-terminal domain-containing protein n=1 Tax=hydrothermal vent metagenome TaxID=652676 RepID=A0A3B0ZDH0_9ZZZZ
MLIINSVFGDATGGRWQVVCDYSNLLRKQGHEVVMVLSDTLPGVLQGIPTGIEVLRLRNHGHYDWLAAWRLARRLRDRKPSLAIAHCSRSVALLKRALGGSVPVLAVTHSTKVRRLLKADGIIALTNSLREKIQAESQGRPFPVYVIPNQIVLPSGGCPPPRPLQRPPVIGALGRFDRVKGFDVFIDALGQLAEQGQKFTARLAGAGEEEARLREQIQALGLGDYIELTGWVPPEEVSTFLSKLDLLCVTARSDAFGLTPLQGAAVGVPMVLSEASGHCAMFAKETEALFFTVDDTKALADRIRQLLGDPGLQKRLPANAFKRLECSYSEAAVATSILEAISKTLNSFNKI